MGRRERAVGVLCRPGDYQAMDGVARRVGRHDEDEEEKGEKRRSSNGKSLQ